MNIPYPSIIKWPANINDHIQRVLILSPDFTNKNNISVPSAYLIGNDEDGRVYDLKAVLESYISFLNELAQDDQVMKERICSAIDLSDQVCKDSKDSETRLNWVIYTLKGKTLGQAVNILTHLQFESKKLESELLSFMLREISVQN